MSAKKIWHEFVRWINITATRKLIHTTEEPPKNILSKKFNIQTELNNIAKLKGALKRSENWEILVSNMAAGFGGGVTETENGGKGTMRYASHVPGKARACSSS